MHSRIANIGLVDLDQIKVILLLNAFRNNSEHLQSSLYSIMDSPSLGANTILCRLQQEDTIIHTHADQSGNAATTLTAICRDKPPCVCSNCKKEGHLASYCIQTGEGMVGKTLDEVRTAQWMARCNGHSGNGNGTPQQTSGASAGASTNVATAS